MTLVSGRWVAQHGLPHVDHLTIAGHGRRWIDEQWLAQWTMYELWRLGGYALLSVVAAALVASAFGVLAFVLLERGSQPRRTLKWTTLAFAAALPDVAVRAQDFAYPLFAVLCWLLLRPPTNRRLAAMIALLVLWANLHGSVLVGSLLVAASCARRVRLLPWAVAALAAPLATPYGYDVVHYYRSVLGNSALQRFASEWKPVTADPLAAIGFLGLVVVLAYVLTVAWRRGVRPELPLLVATAALVVAGFAELRWETWAAFPAVILATDLLNAYDPSPPSTWKARPALVAVGLAAAAGLAVLAAQSAAGFERRTPRHALAATARFALAHSAARILADDVSSDALLWKEPALLGRVGFDDRLEVYRPAAVSAWADVVEARRRPLPGYDVLVASSRNELARRIASLRGWRVVYDGGDGAAGARTR